MSLTPAPQHGAPETPRWPGVRLEPALAAQLAKDPKAVLQIVVRFVATPVRPGPAATLTARREEAAAANATQIASAIAAASAATQQKPRTANVFALLSSVYVEATPAFIEALLDQPGVLGATLNRPAVE